MTVSDIPQRRLTAPSRLGMESAVSVLFLVSSVAYTLAYDAMPDLLRLYLAGGLGLALVIAAIIVIFRYSSLKSLLMCAGLGLVLVSAAVDYAFEPERLATLFQYFADTLRLITVLAAITYFSNVTSKIKPFYFTVSCIATTAASLATFALLGTVALGDDVRPAPFTGGVGAMHSSAYALTSVFFAAVMLWRQAVISRRLALALIVPLAGLILFFQVRTTWLMVIAYFATIYVARLRQNSSRWMLGLGIILILLLGVTVYQMIPDAGATLSDFSSGRTDAYLQRFGALAGRTPFKLIFGTGAGSDFVFTEIWSWNTGIDSHNTFIHFTFETGVVGLIGVLLVLAAATISANLTQIAVIASLVAASLVSNGPLERPALGVMFAALLLLGQTAPQVLNRRRTIAKPVATRPPPLLFGSS